MTEEQAVRYGTGEACRGKTKYRQTYPVYSGICSLCKGVFFRINNNSKYEGMYCSQLCGSRSKAGITLEKRNCEYCKSEFQCRPCEAKRFCNVKCSASFQWERDGKRDRFVDYRGYVKVRARNHPKASKYGKHVAEHILVMESHLGRYLRTGENVHHRNGQRSDNRLSNLELWTTSQPSGQRVSNLIDFVVDNYEKEVALKLEIKKVVAELTESLSLK